MTSHTVTLVFDDGRIARIQADEHDTIYLAALKNRIRIETDCLEGACATCKGVCTSGEYRMDEYSEDALSAEEAARREVLTCQMHVLSDCVIEYPYPSTFSLKAPPATRKGRVAGIETVAESVVRLVVEPEDGDRGPVVFMPGQYVHLGIPGTDAVRSYSFANPPEETGRYTFFIKVLEEGAMSDYVVGPARPGDEMPVTGPFGRFYLRPPARPIVMVAGGTGLAPMLSMFDHMLATGATGQPIHLLYGANTPAELFLARRARCLCRARPRPHHGTLRRRGCGRVVRADRACDDAAAARSPELRRLRRLSLRTAADDRRRHRLAHRRGDRPGRDPQREIPPELGRNRKPFSCPAPIPSPPTGFFGKGVDTGKRRTIFPIVPKRSYLEIRSRLREGR